MSISQVNNYDSKVQPVLRHALRGKTPQVMITAVSRELSGFLWAAMNLVA
ncbi:hypothetical protein [Leptospira borgpetersenii]|nr:hypothetical protein [Leptospira borgpetersenii]UVA65727.1 hypothetical protein LH336_11585 [Leptospira borgpetersenii]